MTKTDKNINYGSAMKSLFEGLKSANEKVKSNDDYKYPNDFGRLEMAVKLHLIACTDMTFESIDKELNPPKETESDIPPELFMQPGTANDLNQN